MTAQNDWPQTNWQAQRSLPDHNTMTAQNDWPQKNWQAQRSLAKPVTVLKKIAKTGQSNGSDSKDRHFYRPPIYQPPIISPQISHLRVKDYMNPIQREYQTFSLIGPPMIMYQRMFYRELFKTMIRSWTPLSFSKT